MSNYPLVQFVDGPSVGATVRLDLNDQTAPAPRNIQSDFDLGSPTLEGDPDAVGQVFGFRSPRFTVKVNGSKANALAFVSALSKEMLRRSNWVLFQLNATTSPKWFKTYRTGYESLSLEQVFVRTNDGGNVPQKDTWKVTVPLVADAFAYGARETIPTAQIVQAPADLTGPVRTAMRLVLPALKGDAPTRLRVTLSPTLDGPNYRSTYLLGCVAGVTAMADPVVDIGTSDGFTATSAPATTNAAYFGGSYRTVTVAANDLTTGSNFKERLLGSLPVVPAGRYKVLLRCEADSPASTKRTYLFGFGQERGTVGPPTYGSTVSLPVGDATYGSASTFQGWVDLGDFTFPFGTNLPAGVTGTMPAQGFHLKVGTAENGSGTVRLDGFKLIPLDGPTVGQATLLSAAFSAAIASAQCILDGDAETYWALDNVGKFYDSTPSLRGGFLVADPAQAQNLLLLIATSSGNTGGSASATSSPTSLNAPSSLVISYYPRFLYVGDGL